MEARYSEIGGIQFEFKNEIIREEQKTLIHYHNAYEIVLLLESDNELFIKDSKYYMGPKQIILIQPYVVHKINYKSGKKYLRYVLNFEYDAVHRIICNFGGESVLSKLCQTEAAMIDLSTKPFKNACNLFNGLLKINEKCLKSGSDENVVRLHLALTSFLFDVYDLFIKDPLIEKSSESEGLVHNVINYVNMNYMNDINLDKLAKEFFTSKYYLCHKFKKTTGISIIEYLQHVRIATAQNLLTSTNTSILEICSLCGFNNIQHFYRVFKKVTGFTPGLYQKQDFRIAFEYPIKDV